MCSFFDKPTIIEPPLDCTICPRLYSFRSNNRLLFPEWYNNPVPIFVPEDGLLSTELLIVGLAPGLQGANKTGRPFTADYAGDLLYSTLTKYGLAKGNYQARADDNLTLIKTAIINAVRCVPPANKPIGSEINNCRQFMAPLLYNLPNLKSIISLGTIAHNSILKAAKLPLSMYKFKHNALYKIKINDKQINLISSYHCSRYNTNTGRLTTEMFYQVFDRLL